MNVKAVFFSPTGKTEKYVKVFVSRFVNQEKTSNTVSNINITDLKVREGMEALCIGKEELLVLGVPVYAGRVPNILLTFLSRIKSDGGRAVAIVNYGNRDYDDALSELVEILKDSGLTVIAAAAFVSQHAFSDKIAFRRPDNRDLMICDFFSQEVIKKMNDLQMASVNVPGQVPPRPYYKPLDINGLPYDFRKIKPVTSSNCNNCGKCAVICPMDAIDRMDYSNVKGTCIKCCACVKGCPTGSKRFMDTNFIKHKLELEDECTLRCEPSLFLE